MKHKGNKSADKSWLGWLFAILVSFFYTYMNRLVVRESSKPIQEKEKILSRLKPVQLLVLPSVALPPALQNPPALQGQVSTYVPAPVTVVPAPHVPLLKFSILVEKRFVQPVAEKAKSVDKVITVVKLPKHQPSKANDVLFRNLTLTDVINENFKLLNTMNIVEGREVPLMVLIKQLAFIYRFHILILSLKTLMPDGQIREDFYHVRSLLVHNINHDLFKGGVLKATQAALREIDLSELKELDVYKQELSGAYFAEPIKALPLYQALHAQEDIHKEVKIDRLQKWLLLSIIPLLNSISCYSRNKDYQQRRECMDACKMVSIIAGEYCPSPDRKHPAKQTSLTPFIDTCRKNRKLFAHNSLTKNINKNNDELIALAKKVTKDLIGDDLLDHCLSPHGAKAQRKYSIKK